MSVTGFLKRLFGTKHDREVRRLLPLVARINELAESYIALSDSELQAKTPEFRRRLEADP